MHRKPRKEQRYGFFSFAIDLISIPVTIFVWAVEKAIDTTTSS